MGSFKYIQETTEEICMLLWLYSLLNISYQAIESVWDCIRLTFSVAVWRVRESLAVIVISQRESLLPDRGRRVDVCVPLQVWLTLITDCLVSQSSLHTSDNNSFPWPSLRKYWGKPEAAWKPWAFQSSLALTSILLTVHVNSHKSHCEGSAMKLIGLFVDPVKICCFFNR